MDLCLRISSYYGTDVYIHWTLRRFRANGSSADDHKLGISDDDIFYEIRSMIATLEEGNLTTIISMATLKEQSRYTITKHGKTLGLYNMDEDDEDSDTENGSSLFKVNERQL